MTFVSYEYLSHDYYGYDPKTNEYRWGYKIIDSEWEAVAVVHGGAHGDAVGGAVWGTAAVIQEYGKRELPVAANLIRAFQFISFRYGYSIQTIIDWNKQLSPQYKQYEEEIERYLVLL